MNNTEQADRQNNQPDPEKPQKKNYGIAIAIGLLVIWVIVRPGVFTIQPNNTLPEGITIVYNTRSPGIPFFSSAEGLCLAIEGDVTSTCRETALAAARDLDDRTLFKLPYSQWAYLQSTGGLEFDR